MKSLRVPYNRGLVYHKVSPDLEWGLTTTTPGQFKAQMLYLQSLGFDFARMQDAGQLQNPVYLTFDDGYANIHHHAAPVLADLGATATVYVITDYIGRKNSWDYFTAKGQVRHLNWGEIRELDRLSWEIGSHACSHENLLHVPQRIRQEELSRSRAVLEDGLGHAITSFSAPFNAWDLRLLEEIGEAGYTSFAISWPMEPLPPWSGFILPRLGVYLHDIHPLFQGKLFPGAGMAWAGLSQQFINAAARLTPIRHRLRQS